jgi:protein-disulfide isomerase
VAVDTSGAPVKGPRNAPVQIVAFSDFQCPFCSRVNPTMEQIEKAYENKVAIYFKQYPLPFHDKAPLAAEAALAAHEQGKFWQMHDKLFGNQQALDRASLENYAQELGLDMAKFKSALDTGKFKDQVQKDLAQGSSAGVNGTPSFVINGKLLVGAQPFDEFKKMIDAELAKKN